MLRTILVVLLTGSALVASGCGGAKPVPETLPSSLSAAAPLLNSITAAIPGLTQTQAILGAGSVFGLAKTKMPADQFSSVASSVPGADALASEAAAKGLPASLTGMADVTKFLKKSGFSSAQVGQLIPVIGSAVKSATSPEIANAFMAAIS